MEASFLTVQGEVIHYHQSHILPNVKEIVPFVATLLLGNSLSPFKKLIKVILIIPFGILWEGHIVKVQPCHLPRSPCQNHKSNTAIVHVSIVPSINKIRRELRLMASHPSNIVI